MTRKPATNAAEYEQNTRDENKQRELHPHDIGSLDLTAMRTMPRPQARAIWALASDSDKRGLAIQCIRHGNHGPDEETIAMYLDILEGQLGLSPIEAAVVGSLKRLAETHQRSAESAEGKEERTYFRRWAGAFRKALLYYTRDGVRPEQMTGGSWLVQSATRGGTVHGVERNGECSCEAQNQGCWHSALVTGIETAYDDMDRFDGGDEGGPIVVSGGAGAVTLQRGDVVMDCRDSTEVARAIGALIRVVPDGTPSDDFDDVPAGPGEPERSPCLDDPIRVRSLVDRLSAARARLAA